MFTRLPRLTIALCLFLALRASAATLYVDINSTNPIPPFSSWATAATNIQDAVDATSRGSVVLVTNGVYQYGGRTLPGSALTNRLIITNGVAVRSVNGPLVTTIAGYQVPGDITGDSAVRCVYLGNTSTLTGFTITQGATLTGGNDVEAGGDTSGAGILCDTTPRNTASDCIIVSNVAGDFGGGIYNGYLISCLVVSNSALLGSYGGGTFATLSYNSTITANSAAIGAGDAFGTLYNCIVYGNYATLGKDYDFDTLDYCCTTPDPGGTGNVIANPLFVNPAAGNFRLQAGSPCVNAGFGIFGSNIPDLAGNPRISGGIIDMGAYELQFHYVDINSTNPVAPFASWATAATNIQDAVDAASNYDEVLVSNGVYQTAGRADDSGLTNRLIITNAITVQSVNGPNVTVIQGDPNEVRCALLTSGAAVLSGFTLTNGATQPVYPYTTILPQTHGGGILCYSSNAIVSNCVITGNSAGNQGGGASGGTLYNCTLAANTSEDGEGGGAYGSTLINCLIVSNAAALGGGGSGCTLNNCLVIGNNGDCGGTFNCNLNNCTITGNSAPAVAGNAGHVHFTVNNCIMYYNSGGNYSSSPFLNLNYCCTTPLPPGPGNITNDPLFVNPATGDFHLQSNSPCINAGNNAYVSTTNDLDGNPRISGGTVDIGAYEFQNPASIISYAWLEQYGFATDGSADFADPDHDGMNNYQEWIAGTDPTNPLSLLQMLSPAPSGTNVVVTWQSETNITYFLQRATNLSVAPAFQTIATNLPGQSGNTSYTDTNAPAPGPYYYRIGVQQP